MDLVYSDLGYSRTLGLVNKNSWSRHNAHIVCIKSHCYNKLGHSEPSAIMNSYRRSLPLLTPDIANFPCFCAWTYTRIVSAVLQNQMKMKSPVCQSSEWDRKYFQNTIFKWAKLRQGQNSTTTVLNWIILNKIHETSAIMNCLMINVDCSLFGYNEPRF